MKHINLLAKNNTVPWRVCLPPLEAPIEPFTRWRTPPTPEWRPTLHRYNTLLDYHTYLVNRSPIHQPSLNCVEYGYDHRIGFQDPIQVLDAEMQQNQFILNSENLANLERELFCDLTSFNEISIIQAAETQQLIECKQQLVEWWVDYQIQKIQDFFQQLQDESYRPSSDSFSTQIYLSKPVETSPPQGMGYSIRSGGGSNNGGGYNGNGGSGGFDWDEGPPNNPNYLGLFILGCVGIATARCLYTYSYQLLRDATDKWIQKFLDKKQQEGQNAEGRGKPWAYLLPALSSGLTLVILSYVLSPDHIRAIIERCEALVVVLAREMGLMLLQLIPPQLHVVAQRLAEGIEHVGQQIHYLIHQIFIPAVLFLRSFTLFAIQIYCVLKCLALGVELYGWISGQIPTSWVTHAREMAQSLQPSGVGTSVELFLINFSKCLSVLLMVLIPETLPTIIQMAVRVFIVCVFVLDTYFMLYLKKAIAFLLTYPMFTQLCSSIAGRWSLIVATMYYINNSKKGRRMSVIFIFCLYFFRVYELAMTATPNFLP